MSGQVKGRADYLLLGDWNAACSMCGRKRKASQLVRNWQGLYRCPSHNEPRQPQDFVRNVKDVMTVPWAQPEQNTFTEFELTFPAWASPSSISSGTAGLYIETTGPNPQVIQTTSSQDVTDSYGNTITDSSGRSVESSYSTEGEGIEATGGALTSALVQILTPGWVTVYSWAWSWASGGAGIQITSPNGDQTAFSGAAGSSGVAQCLVTSILENPMGNIDIYGAAKVLVPVVLGQFVYDSYGNIVKDSYGNPIVGSA